MNRFFRRKYAFQFLGGFFVGLIFLVIPCYLYFVRNDVASIITLFGIFLTAYVAFYAIAWAKYEFHITRQSQQVSILSALCATDKRKSFAPAIAEMTNKTIQSIPTLFSPTIIFSSLCSTSDKFLIATPNPDTISMVSKIILGYDDWKEARLYRINLENAKLHHARLGKAQLTWAKLNKASLVDADLTGAKFLYASLVSANLHRANCTGANFRNANLENARLFDTNFSGADLSHAKLHGIKIRRTNFSGTNLSYADFGFIDGEPIMDDSKQYAGWIESLRCAETLYNAKLPPALFDLMTSQHEHLFICKSKYM